MLMNYYKETTKKYRKLINSYFLDESRMNKRFKQITMATVEKIIFALYE